MLNVRKRQTFLILVLFFSLTAQANDEREYRKSIDRIGGEIKQISQNLNANKKLLKTAVSYTHLTLPTTLTV